MITANDEASLALLFHLNSEPWMNLEAYTASSVGGCFGPLPRSAQLLPAPASSAVRDALLGRRSCRQFANAPLGLTAVATLLDGAYGSQQVPARTGGEWTIARPVPSAGGLYPFGLYVLARSVTGLTDGVYRYHPLHHALEPVLPAPSSESLHDALMAQVFVENSNLLVFLVAKFARTLDKYGPRGYRYLLLEAGHVGQALTGLAVELDLTTLCIGGFHDRRMCALLSLNRASEGVLYAVAIGHAARSPLAGSHVPG